MVVAAGHQQVYQRHHNIGNALVVDFMIFALELIIVLVMGLCLRHADVKLHSWT